MPSVKYKSYRQRAIWCLVFAIALAVASCLTGTSTASAQNLEEYFQLNYDPVTFDKQEINGGEDFYATITGRATCTQDLPVSVSEATINSLVIAEHTASGTTVTLNSSYTITIKPFPSKKDITAEINQNIPLKFPAQAESGEYNVIGRIIEAKVKVGFASMDVTSFLPQDQPMGTVTYNASGAPALPESPPPAQPEPAPEAPLKSVPSGDNMPAPYEPEQIIPWWVWLVVVVAVASIIMNIVLLARGRAG